MHWKKSFIGNHSSLHSKRLQPSGLGKHPPIFFHGHVGATDELFPSVLDIVGQQVEQGLCHYLSGGNASPILGPNTVENLENKIVRTGYSSLEIEARLGLLKSLTGKILFDQSLIAPAILQNQPFPLWKFVPSVSRKSFLDIKNFVKRETEAVNMGPSIYLQRPGKRKIRQPESALNRIQILPNRDTIDMFYDKKLRVSYSSERCEPICAIRKHSIPNSASFCRQLRLMNREYEVLQLPDPVICLIPDTRVVMRFCVVQEEYLPLSKVLDEIKPNSAMLKAVRHKKCNSVTIGNIWRIDLKRVAWWSIDETISKKNVSWFLENSPLNAKNSKVKPAHVTHEVELELSNNVAETLYLDSLWKRTNYSRFADLIESYLHNTQMLAMAAEEYELCAV